MSNSIGVTFNFLSSKYFRNNLAMSQTLFTIKLGKISRNNKPPVAPAKCGEEARLYFTQLFPSLWYILSKAENECYKLASNYITVSIIMTLKHLGNKLHEAITVRYLSHESCKTFILKEKKLIKTTHF